MENIIHIKMSGYFLGRSAKYLHCIKKQKREHFNEMPSLLFSRLPFYLISDMIIKQYHERQH